ncbi:hypothetical protein Ancab_027374 [Ancistrocladus abbreviatus]
MDMTFGGSNAVESNEAGGITHKGGIMVKEVGGQKQEKGMDIEKLVSRSDVVDYPHVTLDGGPEEGEIYDRSEGMLNDECKSQRFEIRASDGHKKAQKLEVVKRDKKRKDGKAAKDPSSKSLKKNKRQAAEAEEVLAASSACDPVPHNKRFRGCKTERKENKPSININESWFQSRQRICYTRDQLLELKESPYMGYAPVLYHVSAQSRHLSTPKYGPTIPWETDGAYLQFNCLPVPGWVMRGQ